MGTESHGLARIEPLVLIGAGGFAGAILRHALAIASPAAFPWGTLAANVGGSFLLSILLYEAHIANVLSPETRLVVGTGFCSSFTTYSTFAAETAHLSPQFAALNVGVNYALGFGAVLLGQVVARWVS
jgi:CrcB protein